MLVELLNQNDKNLFYDYTGYYLNVSPRSTCCRASVEDLLESWDSHKSEYLWDVMQHNFILRKKVNFMRSSAEMRDAISAMMEGRHYRTQEGEGYRFADAYAKWIKKYTRSEEFIKMYPVELTSEGVPVSLYYRNDCDYDRVCQALEDLISISFLRSNVYDDGNWKIPLLDGTTMCLQNGAKTIKLLGKIFNKFRPMFDCEDIDFERFRIKHSQILNEKSLSGNMVLSIHPMDYVTASDNGCNWSSCMNWEDGGEYHRGTIEMMNSRCVVVAYLESENEWCPIDSRPWSNKKWREFFIVDPTFVVGIKGYPYWNEVLEGIALDWLKELLIKSGHMKGKFTQDKIDYRPGEQIVLDNGVPCYIDFSSYQAMYVDFYGGNHHQLYITNKFNEKLSETYRYCYSSAATCMYSGEISDDFNGTASVVCADYDTRHECELCGDTYDEDDLVEVDGSWICPYCYDDLDLDVIDHSRHLGNSMVEFHVYDPETKKLYYSGEKPVHIYEGNLDQIPIPVYKLSFSRKKWGWNETYLVFNLRDIFAAEDNLKEKILYDWMDYGWINIGKIDPDELIENSYWGDVDEVHSFERVRYNGTMHWSYYDNWVPVEGNSATA